MTAVRRMSAIGLAVLLLASTAAADTVITADEVIHCWDVTPAGSDSVCFTLPRLELRTLSTLDVYEVRLPDSSRVAALSERLPQLRVVLDAGQPVPDPAVRIRETLRLRLVRTREARAKGLLWCADVMDTLPRGASPAQMAAWCRDMEFVLRERGTGDEEAAVLLREVSCEAEALRSIGPNMGTCCLYGTLGALLGGLIGVPVGYAIRPGTSNESDLFPCGPGPVVGAAVGCATGAVIGTAGTWMRSRLVTAQHRDRVNDLARRVNRAVASAH